MLTHTELKELLKSHGLSVPRAAQLLHVSASGLYKWLNGQRVMPDAVFAHLQLILAAREAAKRSASGKVLRIGDNWSVR